MATNNCNPNEDLIVFEKLDDMLKYFECHEDKCDMWVSDTRAFLSQKGNIAKKISNEIFDLRCFAKCFESKTRIDKQVKED